MLAAVLCFLLVAGAAAQLSASDQQRLVVLHNNVRADPTLTGAPAAASPLAALTWDSTIASDAQYWASQCKRQSSTKFINTIYGENLVSSSPPSYFNVDGVFQYFVANGGKFNFTTKSCATGSNCMSWQQIMNKNTYAFGCGVATCTFGSPVSWFVCNYKAFGQYSGTIPYTPATNGYPTQAPRPPTSPPSTTGTAAPSTPAPSTPAPSTGGYASIDHRGTRLVQAIKDQKQCGSCWAFGATALAEAAIASKAGGAIAPLSEQSVLDCSTSGSCNGGWPSTALQEMINRGGVDTMSSYPYTQVKSTCRSNSANYGGSIKMKYTTAKTFDGIYNALKNGPVGIAIEANDKWYSYRSGVLGYSSTRELVNHAVTVVGYDAPLNAWIVRNSWGTSWGASGYIYISASPSANMGLDHNGGWYATA